MEISDLHYVSIKGEGYFCIVKKYIDEQTGQVYALKELKKEHYTNEDYRTRLIKEINLLNDLKGCKYIVQTINSGNDVDSQKLWYLMPYAEYNLHEFIKKRNNSLKQNQRFIILEQIISAIKFAHDKNILHRDISPNNILVFVEDGKIRFKISDFGLGKITESLSYYTGSSASGYGQILYVSPEQREKLKDATVKSDIYSLGKLVYFIFTGKDPVNIKQFVLSSLVSKATADNPEERFKNIDEFKTHFEALKKLQLSQTNQIENVTFNDIIHSNEVIDIIHLHEILVKGTFFDHVYHDYIAPVNNYLLSQNNLNDYYNAIGSDFREFVKTYSERLDECYKSVRWPFSSMSTFGKVLTKIVQITNDDEIRLLCFKQLWFLAFEMGQLSVQHDLKSVFNDTYITIEIETQLSEYIMLSETKIEMSYFLGWKIPKIVKYGIINSNKLAISKLTE